MLQQMSYIKNTTKALLKIKMQKKPIHPSVRKRSVADPMVLVSFLEIYYIVTVWSKRVIKNI